MGFLPINLIIPAKISKQIKKEAKEFFPLEWLSYVLGENAGTNQEIHQLFTPADLTKYSTKDKIEVPAHWLLEALDLAESEGLSVLGDIHSHPFDRLWEGWDIERQLSESDIDSTILGLAGVVVVRENKDGKLRCSEPRFWGQQIPVLVNTK